jgi:ribonucleoside-triphosphate reductase
VCKTHGYIKGEIVICPECGEKTEVYSRITGYYRPIRNWNDGKSQEYKERLVYDIENSVIDKKEEAADSHEIMLFTTKTCPNCVLAKNILDDAGIGYKVIDAEENAHITNQYRIMQAPTLIVSNGDEYERFINASNIQAFTESLYVS